MKAPFKLSRFKLDVTDPDVAEAFLRDHFKPLLCRHRRKTHNDLLASLDEPAIKLLVECAYEFFGDYDNFADEVRWIAANAERDGLVYTHHTGGRKAKNRPSLPCDDLFEGGEDE